MKQAIAYCFTSLFLFSTSFGQAQLTFPKTLFSPIFDSYQKAQTEFFGIFDSIESVFVVHTEPALQSPFDSNCLLSSGKAWHRGQLTTFTTYLTIDTVVQVAVSEDSSMRENDHWALQLPELKAPGSALWKCEGEFSMNEDISQKFSGKFTGIFTIYFLYNSKTHQIKALEQEQGFGLEPGMLFSGFWKPYNKINNGSVSFFFANTRAKAMENGTQKLPDLRIQQDGTSSFSNIVIFPQGVLTPPANWYQ
jgi:hypothetical protein